MNALRCLKRQCDFYRDKNIQITDLTLRLFGICYNDDDSLKVTFDDFLSVHGPLANEAESKLKDIVNNANNLFIEFIGLYNSVFPQ